MKILVVGAGSVGGYFGARLAEAGRDVTFLVRPRRAAQIRSDGMQIVSPHGNLTLHPTLVSAQEITASYDLILLGVKAYGLESAMSDFAPAVGPGTTILPLLNGMRHLDILSARFGEAPVIGGACHVSTDLDFAGRIVQLVETQKIIYGERSGGTSDRVRAVDRALQGAGFDVQLSANILNDMAEKWVMLASLGATTCLFRGTIGEVEAAPGGRELALQILAECAAILSASGYPSSEKNLSRARSLLSTPGSKLTASMFRDMIAGGPTEADHILGDLLARGRAHGLECLLLQAAYVSLSVYQRRLADR